MSVAEHFLCDLASLVPPRSPELPLTGPADHARSAVQTRFARLEAGQGGLGRVVMSGAQRKARADHAMRRGRRRTFGRFALVYLVDGAGFYADDTGREQRIEAGTLILVFPDLPHAYGPERGDTWQEFLVFEGPVFDLWREAGLLDDRQPLHHLEPIDHWLRRLQSVLADPHPPGSASALREVTRLQDVLADALTHTGRAVRTDEAQWAERACALLESRLRADVDLHEVAAAMGTGYESFRKRFARIVGQPPGRYHAARLVDRACQLMQTTELTDKQIADRLGFCDEFYFSRRFKQVTGQAPRRFRRSLPGGE